MSLQNVEQSNLQHVERYARPAAPFKRTGQEIPSTFLGQRCSAFAIKEKQAMRNLWTYTLDRVLAIESGRRECRLGQRE